MKRTLIGCLPVVVVVALATGCQTETTGTTPPDEYQQLPPKYRLPPQFPPVRQLSGDEAAAVTSQPRGTPLP